MDSNEIKWPKVNLGSLCNIFTGKKDVNQSVTQGKYVFFSCSPKEFYSDDYLYNGDAIIVAGNGSYTGKVRFFSGKFDLYQRTYACVLKPLSTNVSISFLYYVMKNQFEPRYLGGTRGSSIPYIVMGDLANFEFLLPPLGVQRKIAGVLSALDDKIELNNKINQNLKLQAQALFKSWFVDFEPFGSTIPADWKVGNLLSIADYLNGLAMQNFRPLENEKGLPVLKIKELRQGFSDDSSELCSESIKSDYIINDGDVIFSWSGSLLVDFWCGGKCGLNQHLFKVTSKEFDKWFYYSWTRHHLDHFIAVAADKATTMGHIKRNELEKAKVFIPSTSDYTKIGGIISPIYDMIIQNRIENNHLSELRDTLLPKLMSGEINVDKVDISDPIK